MPLWAAELALSARGSACLPHFGRHNGGSTPPAAQAASLPSNSGHVAKVADDVNHAELPIATLATTRRSPAELHIAQLEFDQELRRRNAASCSMLVDCPEMTPCPRLRS